MNTKLEQSVQGALADLAKRGFKKRIRVLESGAGSRVVMRGKEYIQLSSNNYLGLTNHPRVRGAAEKALREFGSGAGAVMPIVGTMTLHEACEARLAQLKSTESAMLMSSGFATNIGVIAGLAGPGWLVISDELNHASIIDGIRLSGAEKRIFSHRDMRALEQHLQDAPKDTHCLVVTDGVFSMDGDIAPLPQIVALVEKYGATLMVDDAHATGVLGARGGGTAEYFGLHGRVDVQVGTLSKALAAAGGFVAASNAVVEFLRQKARPFLFSSALPPSVVATVSSAVDVICEEPTHLRALWDNARFFKDGLKARGFNTGVSETPITPVIVGDSKLAAKMSQQLEEHGVLATEIIFPMVPEKLARLRTIVMASHTREDLTKALEVFQGVGKSLGVI